MGRGCRVITMPPRSNDFQRLIFLIEIALADRDVEVIESAMLKEAGKQLRGKLEDEVKKKLKEKAGKELGRALDTFFK